MDPSKSHVFSLTEDAVYTYRRVSTTAAPEFPVRSVHDFVFAHGAPLHIVVLEMRCIVCYVLGIADISGPRAVGYEVDTFGSR